MRHRLELRLLSLVAGIGIIAAILAFISLGWDGGVLTLVAFVGALALTLMLDPSFQPWNWGRIGEAKALRALETLPDGYTVFDDIEMSGGRLGNVDLAVVGPTGIFAIEVKAHQTTRWFYSSRQRSRNLWQARKEATWMSRQIGYQVEPVLVMAAKPSPKSRFTEDGVRVLNLDELVEFITNYPYGTVLSSGAMDRAVDTLAKRLPGYRMPVSMVKSS